MKKILMFVGLIVAILVLAYVLNVDSYKDATYELEGKRVTLTDGRAEEEITPGSVTKKVTRIFGNEVIGDVNGDGMDDIVFLLTQNSGGTGVFYFVTVALAHEDGYLGINGILLGDRIAPQNTLIRNGEIVVNYAERKLDEPMTTAPSVAVSKYFTVKNNVLTARP